MEESAEDSAERGPGMAMSGFLLRHGRSGMMRHKRFYRLDGAILSKHASEKDPPSWDVNVQGAQVYQLGATHFGIKLKRADERTMKDLYQDRLVLHTRTDSECVDWIAALRYASQRRLKNHYQVGHVIGEGGFAKVRVGRCLRTKELRAIKTMRKDESNSKLFGREIAIIKRVDHPNIVKTYDVFETDNDIHIVMEYMPGGMLYDAIEDGIKFHEADVAQFTRELLDGILYLHRCGIVHRDLKPENVLCTSQTTPLHVKIADFGLSSITSVADMKANKILMSTMIGTPEFVAPEIARQEQYTEKVDMWALGMLCYNVIAGTLPLDERRDLLDQLQDGIRLDFPEQEWRSYSPEAKSFVRSLLCTQPEKRLTALACMVHPWLENAKRRQSAKVAAYGRVSRRLAVLDPGHGTSRRRDRTRNAKTSARAPQSGNFKELWGKAFLFILAFNRLRWSIAPRQPNNPSDMTLEDTLGGPQCLSGHRSAGFADRSGHISNFSYSSWDTYTDLPSDSSDFNGKVSSITAAMKTLQTSFGSDRQVRNSQPSASKLKKRSHPIKGAQRVSYEQPPNSAPAMVLNGSAVDGAATSSIPPRKPTLKEKVKVPFVGEVSPARKFSRKVKDLKKEGGASLPLRKISRKLNITNGTSGMLAPLRKMSRKLSVAVGGKGKASPILEDDGLLDDELGLGDLGVTEVDEGDLLLLEDAELSGPPTGKKAKERSVADGRASKQNLLSPVTPDVSNGKAPVFQRNSLSSYDAFVSGKGNKRG